MTARKKVATRRARRPVLTLSQRVERLEKSILFAKSAAAGPAASRFVNLGKNGEPTMDAQDDWVAVYDRETKLFWTAGIVGSSDGVDWAAAAEAAKGLRLQGHDDWRLPTIQELLSIVDYGKNDPAVDKDHFRGPYGWTWSSTPYAGSAGCAWGVGLGYGGSGVGHQSLHGRVRAVRSGQQLGLSV
jgi:hypothetical protein